MLYIKINKDKFPIEDFTTFRTQSGKDAVRVIGDAPLVNNGFLIVDTDDNVICDAREYKYVYRQDDTRKEYTTVADEIIPAASCYVGDYPIDPVQRQISALNRRVSNITPYTESKTAYIDDEFVLFNIPKDGNISVFMVDNEGQNVAHTFEQINGQIKVSFEKREALATVTISIQ